MEIIEILKSHPLRISIGDPTWLGWATVFAYWTAAILSFLCAWRADRIFDGKRVWEHRFLWGVLSAMLFFLGINKQLDIQNWFTTIVKAISYVQGWYALGQWAQTLFVGALVAAAALVMLLISWRMRAFWRQYWLLMIGFIFLARFIVVRVASFYGVPLTELSHYTGGVRVNWALELVGTAVIILASALNIRRGRAA